MCGKIADNSYFIRCCSDKKSPQEIILCELASCFCSMSLVVSQILFAEQDFSHCVEICYGQLQTHLHAYGLNKTMQLDPFFLSIESDRLQDENKMFYVRSFSLPLTFSISSSILISVTICSNENWWKWSRKKRKRKSF